MNSIVDRKTWLAARLELLTREKDLTRRRDELARKRRALPWVRIEKNYEFEGPGGKLTLSDLFAGRSQLIVQHFMLGPDWEQGCVGCSFLADHADGASRHLAHHDVSLVAISRAPIAKVERFNRRMGWQFPRVSSFGGDFNFDFHVSFTLEQRAAGQAFNNYRHGDPGIDEIGGRSVFLKDGDGSIHHTYSAFGRGDELLIGAYNYLDLTPKGRNETGPNHDLTDWVRHHDLYGSDGRVDGTGRDYDTPPCACEGRQTETTP